MDTCTNCAGTGSCDACDGYGTHHDPADHHERDCPLCQGDATCPTCGGAGSPNHDHREATP